MSKIIGKSPGRMLTSGKLRVMHGCTYGERCTPVNLAYSVTGAKNPEKEDILIMHGLFGSYRNWNTLAKLLNDQTKRQVFCVDARNHGNSPYTPEMSYRHMAEDLRHFIQEYDLKDPIVMGHSIGGRAAMLLSLSYGHLLSKLISVDISPIGTSPNLLAMGDYFKAMRKIDIPPNISVSLARWTVDKQLAETINDLHIREFLLTSLDLSKKEAWRVNLKVLEENFAKELARFPQVSGTFNKPTLFISGSESDHIKDEDIPAIREYFPYAEFKKILSAGHWVHSDQPYDFLEAVISFLNK